MTDPLLGDPSVFPFPEQLTHGLDVYALSVYGDEMSGAGIVDGTMILVHRRTDATFGDIVVAVVGGEATLLYYGKVEQEAWLMNNSSTTGCEPVVRVADATIIGVVAGMGRKL